MLWLQANVNKNIGIALPLLASKLPPGREPLATNVPPYVLQKVRLTSASSSRKQVTSREAKTNCLSNIYLIQYVP